MQTKTKVKIIAIIIFIIFAFGFIWLLSNAFFAVTFGTLFKIAGAFVIAMLISFLAGWWLAK
jgi:hypothetical protein